MQSKISMLQDSLALVQKQLQEERQGQKSAFGFFENPSSQKDAEQDNEDLDQLLRDHSWKGTWSYKIPDPESFRYHLEIPEGRNGYYYDFEYPEVTPCPEISKQKHKHEWMKMLPFGNLFNNN